jgi:hypothetical protein
MCAIRFTECELKVDPLPGIDIKKTGSNYFLPFAVDRRPYADSPSVYRDHDRGGLDHGIGHLAFF